ncbi:hypothetical protein L3Q82_011990, partial [Scortum barcoo]
VLNAFKALHRTRMAVFKDDERALTAARLKINKEFKKNKNETSEENINKVNSDSAAGSDMISLYTVGQKSVFYTDNEFKQVPLIQMIKMGSDVEIVLRETVLQMEHVDDDKLLLRPRENLLLENVPYCDQPRKKS